MESRRRRPRTDYKALPLLCVATAYLQGKSLRELAAEYACNDHKPLGVCLEPYVVALGGRMRTQAESQALRREKERLNTLDDVRTGYWDFALGSAWRARR